MKRIILKVFRMAAILLPLVCSSCMNDVDELVSARKYYNSITFTATSADGGQTKTTRNEDGSLSWLPADEINVFCGTSTSGRFVSDNTEPANVTTFSGHFEDDALAAAGATYWAVYPYSSSNSFDGQNLSIDLPSVQVSEAGSFGAGMFPSVARSSSTNLAFYNVCGGIKFSLSRNDVTSITITSRNGEPLAGKVSISFDNVGRPVAKPVEGTSEITLRPASGGFFEKDTYYYFSILPVTMSAGFMMTFRTNSDMTGTLDVSSSVDIRRSVFSRKDNIDSGVTNWKDTASDVDISDSGIYLGILAFNQTLTYCPIGLLDADKLSQCKSFIDGLGMKNGTILYYAADNGLATMQAASYPQNLTSASLVTFTDGLDQGSLMMNPDYETDEKYLSAVSTRIRKGNVAGLPLSAFSIGIRGSDVSNITKFRNNLTSLATKDENAYEITSISELESRFESIADVVSVSVEYAYDLALTIPGLPDGTRVRFTFDDVSGADRSNLYIEGTFNLKNRTLTDVEYCGLTSTSGTTVTGTVNDIFVRYDFSKVKRIDRQELSRSYLKQWQKTDTGKWQANSEFDKATDSDISVSYKKKSSAVYLVLDCSGSLSGQFGTMKTYVKSFIQKLYDESYVETSASSVKVSADNISLNKGESVRLSATVYPVTATNRAVEWGSYNPSVAVVDAIGNVTAVGSGSTSVYAKSIDGGYRDYCNVTVYDVQIDPDASGNFSQSGLYLGVLAFNNGLYRYPVCRLTEVSAKSINAFIDAVAQRNGSLVYKAVDDAISDIQQPDYPSDLSSAALVTFTDGLDQGSMMKASGYTGNDAYLLAINKKIMSAKVHQVPLSAYSIGIRGDDVTDVDKYRNDLAKLASSDANAYEITSISALQSKLNAIADVVKVTYSYSHTITLTIPGPSNGTRVRFTFDNVSDASKSTMYIEGTFNLKNRSLTDFTYKGLSSTTGSELVGSADGIFVTFRFPDVKLADGRQLSNKYIKEWTSELSGASWQINSEFNSETDTEVSSAIHRNSGVVYLVLDCSSSLGSTSNTVKSDAKDFVSLLQKKSYDQYAVSSVSLNTSQQIIGVGKNVQMTAKVSPSTALDESLSWSSSNPNVATVDVNGLVQGLSIGSTKIRVVTTDGGYSAECPVYVGKISLSDTDITVGTGRTHQLSAALYPEDLPDKSIVWTSSNTSIATVSSLGLVTAMNAGTCTITAKCSNGAIVCSCKVTVFVAVTGVSLSSSQKAIGPGGEFQLTVTVSPSTAKYKSVVWSSSNSSVTTVDASGKVTAVGVGTATITVTANDGGERATCTIIVPGAAAYVDDYVDLGLSVKWASCNLGAFKSEEYGGYYQWAGLQDVTNTSISESSNYPYSTGTGLTKYTSSDNKTVLDLEDDVAHVKLGGRWRMPTQAEWTELKDNCNWAWTTQNGVSGYMVTSNKPGYTSKSIFLPATGSRGSDGFSLAGSGGQYWSSSLYLDNRTSAYVLLFRYYSGSVHTDWEFYRSKGFSVRPVLD